jgi:hypothetical protein
MSIVLLCVYSQLGKDRKIVKRQDVLQNTSHFLLKNINECPMAVAGSIFYYRLNYINR